MEGPESTQRPEKELPWVEKRPFLLLGYHSKEDKG